MQWLNLFLSFVNAVMAYDSFKRGHNKSGWIGVAISAFCFTTAML
jgi:hypothetical protein